MSHAIILFLILVFLVLYSNIFTSGYFIFLDKRQNDWSVGFKWFISFTLSISTIILIFMIPRYLGVRYTGSLLLLGAAFVFNVFYSVKNRHQLLKPENLKELKEGLRRECPLFILWFIFIAFLLIPAIHYPWYFGWGIDWIHHAAFIGPNIIEGVDTFYPALGSHGFFSLMYFLHLPFPAAFQVGVAYFLSINIFPLYFITKKLLERSARYITLFLWLIIPFHYLYYGEYVPNSASLFFYLSFFLIILIILEHVIHSLKEDKWILCGIATVLLAASVYTHQIFLYAFFYIYTLITLSFWIIFRKFKEIIINYSIIGIFTLMLLAPFMKKLISGTKTILYDIEPARTQYYFSNFLSIIYSDIGLIAFLAALLGAILFLISKNKDGNTLGHSFRKIIIGSVFIGTLLAVNIYASGNSIWNIRSYYLLEILMVFPLGYLIHRVMQWKYFLLNGSLLLLAGFLLLNKINYLWGIEAMWPKEIQSSIELIKDNSFLNLKGSENYYLVFNEASGTNTVFFKVFAFYINHPRWLIGKEEYAKRIEGAMPQLIMDNRFYSVSRNGDDIYFDYKTEIVSAYGFPDVPRHSNTKPGRTDILDKMIKRHFWLAKIDQQSMHKEGLGIDLFRDRVVGQSFVPSVSSLASVCIHLGKSSNQSSPIFLELYDQRKNFLITVALSKKQIQQIPFNQYQEFCFPVRQSLQKDTLYLFYIKTTALDGYHILNAGREGYNKGTAYDRIGSIADNLLFTTKYTDLFSW